MSKEKFHITPDMIPTASDYINREDIKLPSEEYNREFKKTYEYKKYVKKYHDNDKKKKAYSLLKKTWGIGLPLLNTLLSLIAAITGIISLLLQLNLL